MKKIAIFILIGIVIISGIAYMYLNYKVNYNIAKKENKQLESYYNEEILGSELVTIINKAVDNNVNNNIAKDNKGKYIANETNSINIDIKFLDDKETHRMEEIYNSGVEKFVNYYGTIKFKCTTIEYHETTKKIKYMLFEQITQ